MNDATASPRKRWLIPTIIAAVVLVAIAIGVVIASVDNGGGNDNASGSVPIANIQQACEKWMDTYSGTRPDGDWCSQMSNWMSQQSRTGTMMGSMMWGNSSNMRSACLRWMADASSSTTTPSGNASDWCDSMVGWMRNNSNGSWGGWMRNGNMMDN